MSAHRSLRISLAQMETRLGAPEENLREAEAWIAEAARRGSGLLLLPELWGSGYALERAGELASPLGEGLFAGMAALARRYRLALGGSLLESGAGGVYNTFVLYAADGSLLAAYRKIHLFGPMEEDRYLRAGAQPLLTEAPWGKTGLAVCYDLRFPELFRLYTLHGAEILLLCAEWPLSRIEHWRILLRARAIENQVFVAAVNRAGESKGTRLGGHSAVLNPRGEVLVEGGRAPLLLTVDVALDDVSASRERFPALRDRRPEAYHLEGE